MNKVNVKKHCLTLPLVLTQSPLSSLSTDSLEKMAIMPNQDTEFNLFGAITLLQNWTKIAVRWKKTVFKSRMESVLKMTWLLFTALN